MSTLLSALLQLAFYAAGLAFLRSLPRICGRRPRRPRPPPSGN